MILDNHGTFLQTSHKILFTVVHFAPVKLAVAFCAWIKSFRSRLSRMYTMFPWSLRREAKRKMNVGRRSGREKQWTQIENINKCFADGVWRRFPGHSSKLFRNCFTKRLGSYSPTNFEYKNQFCFVIKKAATDSRPSLRSRWFAYDYTNVFSAPTADMKEYYVLLQPMSNPELQGVDRIKKKKTTIIYHKESRKIEFPLPTLAKHRTQTLAAPLE